MRVSLTVKEGLPLTETYKKLGRMLQFTISDQDRMRFEKSGIINAEVSEITLSEKLNEVIEYALVHTENDLVV